ncbi:hypothetical protein BTA51_16095 [Hahella sp. CCB-MM4]|nr:hypothetical protein BTA51_16095 [Hahella sp. CCB-MM4]
MMATGLGMAQESGRKTGITGITTTVNITITNVIEATRNGVMDMDILIGSTGIADTIMVTAIIIRPDPTILMDNGGLM